MRTWQRLPILAVILAIAIGGLAGCMNREAPLAPASPPGVRFSEAVAPVQLVFLNTTYNGDANQTTFVYQLQPTPATTEAPTGVLGIFTDISLEIPGCAPSVVGYGPTDGATVGTTIVGFDGITWGVGYDDNEDLLYAVTYPGELAAGASVRALVSTGGFFYIQTVVGPCSETGHQVAGTVFIDTDGNGLKGATEFGIAEVTVELSEGAGEGTPQTVKTDSEGNYVFIATDGDYVVSIPPVTAASDFNETLYATWNNTTPTAVNVTVSGADLTGVDFGWEPDIDAIIAALDAGDLTSEGKSYKWWRKEFLRVLNGNANTAYTEDELLAFVHEIEELALLDEFDFTEGNELQEVYDILNNHTFEDGDGEAIGLTPKYNGRPDPYFDLLRELLTSELNFVSGRGLNEALLHEILLMWGEGVSNANAPAPSDFTIGLPGDGDEPRLIESPVEAGTKVFGRLNGATGGGGTN